MTRGGIVRLNVRAGASRVARSARTMALSKSGNSGNRRRGTMGGETSGPLESEQCDHAFGVAVVRKSVVSQNLQALIRHVLRINQAEYLPHNESIILYRVHSFVGSRFAEMERAEASGGSREAREWPKGELRSVR